MQYLFKLYSDVLSAQTLEQVVPQVGIEKKISEQQLEITKLIGLISEVEAKSQKHLFALDSLSLWKGIKAEIFSRFKLPRGIPGGISMLTRYTIIKIGFFLAISVVGVDLGKFGLLAGALGVGLGFGLRNIIENFVSGLIIIFERPIEVGDTVEIGDVFGNVEKIGIRSSTVKTFDGSEVIVPNGSLISNQVTNWTFSDRQRRMQLPVKVAFGNDPHKVLELLRKVAGKHAGVLEIPEPQAFFNGFGDNYLDFTLYYWVSDNILQIKSEIALAVHDTIKDAGIDTPRPKGDFNLKFINAPEKYQYNV